MNPQTARSGRMPSRNTFFSASRKGTDGFPEPFRRLRLVGEVNQFLKGIVVQIQCALYLRRAQDASDKRGKVGARGRGQRVNHGLNAFV
jgi:hypothetical protein